MKINRKRIGQCLLSMRKKLGDKQSYLATKLDISQSIISALETGSGGGIEPLFKLMEYYIVFFEFDNIFTDDFQPKLRKKRSKTLQEPKADILTRLETLKKDIGNLLVQKENKKNLPGQISSPESKNNIG